MLYPDVPIVQLSLELQVAPVSVSAAATVATFVAQF